VPDTTYADLPKGHCAAEPAKEVLERAARALAAEDNPAAERGFQAVLREQPRQVAALSNLGVICSRTNRPPVRLSGEDIGATRRFAVALS